MRFSRRAFVGGVLTLPLTSFKLQPFGLPVAQAADPVWRHGVSLFGDVKYPPEFAHFDYVNPQAPKGGSVRQIALGTFDNFNQVVGAVKGSPAVGLELIYDTLMVSALDEVSTEYGLLAEGVTFPDDFSSVTYRLRPNAKWHDGTPVTPEDVMFSFAAFKENNPRYSGYYRHVVKF
jgi:microcin C transport system substrate-binding protein